MLAMSAPWSAAQMSALAMYRNEKAPELFVTFIGMIEQPGADPHEPLPLFALAAAMPAQAVPWPGVAELSCGFESLSPVSYPFTTERSGWVRSTPVSRMAMITPGEPNPTGLFQPS